MYVLFFSEIVILILRIIYNKVELFFELKCINILKIKLIRNFFFLFF